MCYEQESSISRSRVRASQMVDLRPGLAQIAGAALFVVAGAVGGQAGERLFSLLITGAEGVRYIGLCTLTTEAGEQKFEISGTVPRRDELEGQSLACRIESTGWLVVEIAQGANRTRAATNGGIVSISAGMFAVPKRRSD